MREIKDHSGVYRYYEGDERIKSYIAEYDTEKSKIVITYYELDSYMKKPWFVNESTIFGDEVSYCYRVGIYRDKYHYDSHRIERVSEGVKLYQMITSNMAKTPFAAVQKLISDKRDERHMHSFACENLDREINTLSTLIEEYRDDKDKGESLSW